MVQELFFSKNRRAACLSAAFLSLLLIFGCSHSNEDDQDQLTLAALFVLQNRFQFRYNTGLSSSSALTRAAAVNMAGTSISNYGDGTGDGFTDAFLTPANVTLLVAKIVAWKSQANGGPAPGAERESNADYVVFDCSRDIAPGTVCAATVTVGSAGASYFLSRWAGLPDETYDRLGISISSVEYEFDASVSEPNLRWISMGLRYTGGTSNTFAMIREAGCPETRSQLAAPCGVRGGKIDASNGNITWNQADAVSSFGTFSPKYPISDYTLTGSAITFTAPADQIADTSEPFYEVVTINAATLNSAPTVYVDLDPTNVMFWDTSSNATIYNAASDGPNGSGKDLKYHLPVMAISIQ